MSNTSFVPTFLHDLSLARAAVVYAEEFHRGQRRESDEAPFVLHPLEVAALLHNSGHREVVVAAGILHDTVEDTPTTSQEIHQRFGPEVAALVEALTEDPTIKGFAARKTALREQIAAAGPDATSIYAADKVTKVRELRARMAADLDLLRSNERDRARLEHYRESLVMLEEATPGHPVVRQLRFELEALAALPPRIDATDADRQR
ncbi:MAG TPA: HD domain-containing protein [Solirubrobacteraceae bacterium]|nr:HD domain-containing protein [Solirubrobacteraceae bacterium]